ncbi:DUF6542 domain-containing protein [Streptomyces sp. NRRL S-37]|uniref:DUF6542 domain-containing protein n=1 Tax=Streptomyces sp. NRRL S-37 TaxID=1463903 RepID=UPI00099C32DE|nr:DUF6542 domain-containing protein [Streptomyces sp. NRRL S-37]
MEQHRTRPARYGRYGPRRDRPAEPPLPPPAGRAAGGGVARPVRPARVPVSRPTPPPAVRRLPNPRLTGLGLSLFCGLVALVLGLLTDALFGSSGTVYGVLFLPVCVLTALWVREGDLLVAPVVVPIAFAVGLVPLADGGDGTGGRLMGMVTGLATQAGWLYGGTLVTSLIVLGRRVRRVRGINRRVARNRPRP